MNSLASNTELQDWILAKFSEEGTTDMCLDGNQRIFVESKIGGRYLYPGQDGVPSYSLDTLRLWLLEKMQSVGKTWDARNPFVDASLPEGLRLHAAFAPITQTGISISLRRLPVKYDPLSPAEFIPRFATDPAYGLLKDAVKGGQSMIICGATGGGKTTLATDLLSEIPKTERLIALEDTPELLPKHPGFLSLLSRPASADGFGEVTLRNLLRQSLRMRPDRIILGECRGPEVLDLLQILNTGHKGALATLHALSARDALKRLELLCLLGGQGELPSEVIRELIASGIDLLVHVEKTNQARAISEILSVAGREGNTILLRPIYQHPSRLQNVDGICHSNPYGRPTRC